MNAALAVHRPIEEDESQQTFAWMEPGSRKLLAIPRDDLARWRVRSDIKSPRFFAMHDAWMRDARYHALKRLVKSDAIYSPLAVFSAIGFVAYELIRNSDRQGLQRDTDCLTDSIVQVWGFADVDAHLIDYAIHRAKTAGIFELVSADDWDAIDAFPSAAQHTSRSQTETPNRQCATDRGASDETDEHAGEHAGDDDDSPSESRSLPDAANENENDGVLWVTDRGVAMPKDHEQAVDLISNRIAEHRKKRGKLPYPAKREDIFDLRQAVFKAWPRGRYRELVDLLRDVADWADSGAGFRKALREGGFI